jgi:uncharacterized protein YdeI (YjbR/CyaY-like superfamily)
MKKVDDLPITLCLTQPDWDTWLNNHHVDSRGVWLKIAKKGGAGNSSVSYSEALDSALCYGWIDGQKAAFDGEYWLQKFTPRTSKSKWSKINREKATELLASGKMKPAGIQEVERAKADGRWEAAYESQRNITIPADFQQELDNNQKAQQFFSTLNSVNRYAILYRIQTAKKPETRASRIRKFIAMLADNQKIYP